MSNERRFDAADPGSTAALGLLLDSMRDAVSPFVHVNTLPMHLRWGLALEEPDAQSHDDDRSGLCLVARLARALGGPTLSTV